MNCAECAATIKSQASTREKPAPAAGPSTAAITGLGQSRRASTHACNLPTESAATERSLFRFSSRRFRLPPAQNVSPAPVNTTARMSGSRSAVSSASIPAAYISGCSALRAPGLESVRMSVASRRVASNSADMRDFGWLVAGLISRIALFER